MKYCELKNLAERADRAEGEEICAKTPNCDRCLLSDTCLLGSRRERTEAAEIDERAERIVDQIEEQTGLSREEVLEEVREKREEFKNFVTWEGAATIVAKQHAVSPKEEN